MASLVNGSLTSKSCAVGGMGSWCGAPVLSSRLVTKPQVQLGSTRRCGAVRAVLDNYVAKPILTSSTAISPALSNEAFPTLTTGKSKRFIFDELMEKLGGAVSQLRTAAQEATSEAMNAFVELAFHPSDEPNLCFQDNFAPVDEIGDKVQVKMISGEVPRDFPAGSFIRNGPNPLFGGKSQKSPFGKLEYQWFEGDGMLHGTFFAGNGSLPSYVNKYVNTTGYKAEKDRKKLLYLTAFEGSAPAMFLSFLLNQLRFGATHKWTCNTSVFQIGEKWYASMEGGLPLQIDPSDLSTVGGYYNANGSWNRAFTAHPKKDPNTGEIVIIGYGPMKPFLELGVISANGQTMVHKVDLKIGRCTVTHEVAITEKYNVIIDYPLLADIRGVLKGQSLLDFNADRYARIGVMPRYGDSKSLKWFDSKPCSFYHVVNSFDDGDEVVVLGISSRVPLIPSKPGMDKKEWFARGVACCKIEDAEDPWVDGALFSRLHEWRLNTRTGTLTERDITGDNFSMEMPKINEKYVGKKNRYAYAACLHLQACQDKGMPAIGGLLKIDYGSVPLDQVASGSLDLARIEEHQFGPGRYGSEPFFVARPNGIDEDDGWVITYIHDESTGVSEVIIIDAQQFQSEPLVRMQLPQRVPYGFHGAYALAK